MHCKTAKKKKKSLQFANQSEIKKINSKSKFFWRPVIIEKPDKYETLKSSWTR